MSNKQSNFISYLPAQAGAERRIIRLVEAQKDPLEPAKFQLNKKVPPPPPEAPVPIMHSPPRKSTADDHAKWAIPPCVSAWKNPRGYTIPLDKRCALIGQSKQPEPLNPKFAQLTEALAICNKQHRIALEERAKSEKLIAQKEKEKNEERLRLIAKKAREERANSQRTTLDHSDDDSDIDLDELEERKKIRSDRHRERIRNVNLKISNPSKYTALDRERDISEKIALGMARPTVSNDDIHDPRLYTEGQGLTSGFAEDDEYAVYDQPWKSQASFSKGYRPSDSVIQDFKDRELESKLPKSSDPDEELKPLQFEKDVEDIFNVESFLRNAKNAANNMERGKDREKSHKYSSKRKRH